METNQIIRIPLKYWELFDTMDNEECWKLIKSLLKWKDDWLIWLTLTYYNIIIVDINNLYNSANNWKKGGRPKKEPGVINKNNQGLWKSITNTSKDKVSKDKESKENNNIFKEYTEEHKDSNLTSILISKLLLLWYTPSATETIETFKEWFTGLNIPISDCKSVITDFYEYWKFEIEEWRVKKTKNWKLTFNNNFRVKDYVK